MKKSIFIFLFAVNILCGSTIRVPELSPKYIEAIRDYQKKHPGPLTIKVEEEQDAIQQMFGWAEWITGKTENKDSQGLGDLIPVKSLATWAFGSTIVSYGAGFYVIYRAYRLLNQAGSWTNSLGGREDDEIILYVRQGNNKILQNTYLGEIKREKEILQRYLKFHKLLKGLRMRWMFVQNRAYDEHIAERVNRLSALERKVREQF